MARAWEKRVIRRISTAMGAFAHLPNYGLTALAKRVARPPEITQAAVRVQEQIRAEPDVREATVSAVVELGPSGGGVVRFAVRVKPREGGLVQFVFQVPI